MACREHFWAYSTCWWYDKACQMIIGDGGSFWFPIDQVPARAGFLSTYSQASQGGEGGVSFRGDSKYRRLSSFAKFFSCRDRREALAKSAERKGLGGGTLQHSSLQLCAIYLISIPHLCIACRGGLNSRLSCRACGCVILSSLTSSSPLSRTWTCRTTRTSRCVRVRVILSSSPSSHLNNTLAKDGRHRVHQGGESRGGS